MQGKGRKLMVEKKVKKHFRDTEKEFGEYFPLFTYNNALGAYDFLCKKGYQKQAEYISELLRKIVLRYKNGRDSEPKDIKTVHRRRLVVGLVFEKNLLDDFLKECWKEEHAPFAFRKHKMEQWYDQYKYGYKPRYGYIIEKN
jgi:hypothetical protein